MKKLLNSEEKTSMVKKTKNNEILVSAEGNDIPMMAEIESIGIS